MAVDDDESGEERLPPSSPREPSATPDAPAHDAQGRHIQVTHPDGWPSLSALDADETAPVEDFLPGSSASGVPLRIPQPTDGKRETPPPSPPPPPATRSKPPRPRRSIFRRVAKWAFLLVAGFILLSVAMVGIYRFVPPPITLTMIGDVFGGHGARHNWRSLSRIDPDMARAVIGAEDSKFCQHNGFDWQAMEKAWKRNQQGGRIRGGSTISQQTAKNVFLWQGGGYVRKGLEAWFTFLIERLWGKRRIMEVYLNVAETGIGTYGVEAGAQRYFKHGADRLTTREAAQIAAVLPLPKQRAGVNPTGFTRRYANSIAARIATVRTQGLDACIR